MGYEWLSTFEDGETRAVCSKCGVPYRYPSEIVRQNDGFFYCKRRCLEQTVLTRDRIQAQSRKRREMPPPKFVQPPSYAEDYLHAESIVLEQITKHAPSSTDAERLGWAVNYMADIVTENERPTAWIARLRTIIATCCNTLLTLQYGAPTGPAPTVTVDKIRYGGFASGTNMYTATTAIAGVALLKGYQILGTSTYLDAANRVGHFLRHMQCQDLDAAGNYTSWNGGHYHIGWFARGCSTSATPTWASTYNLFDAGALWFLDMLADVVGGSASYGSATVSDFSATTVATLDTMVAEATAFLTTGAYDSTQSNALKTGLSTDYPRSTYVPQLAGGTADGNWTLAAALSGTPLQVLPGRDVAIALFALNQVGGAATQVNAVFDWLQTFQANPSNVPQPEADVLLIGNLKGTYDATLGIATALDVLDDDGTTVLARDHVGSGYDWMAWALLAPIASVRSPTNFKRAKDALCVPQPSDPGYEPLYRWIEETGVSGLSLQIAGSIGSSGLGATTGQASTISGPITVASPPTDNMVLWLKSDAGVTKNASNQVSVWADQSPNAYNALAVDATGFALPATQWPVYTPNAIGTLPGLLWSRTLGTNLNCIFPPATFNKITADGTPVTVLAIVKPSDVAGGTVFTMRMNNDDLELALKRYQPSPTRQLPITTAQNAFGYVFLDNIIDYSAQNLVLSWEYYGTTVAGANPIPNVYINGVARALDPAWGPVHSYTGVSGYSVGFCNAVFNECWDGYIAEILIYGGIDSGTRERAQEYLLSRTGTTPDTGPSISFYPYRYSPKAYGDQWTNPRGPG